MVSFRRVTDELTSPGAPFELAEESVLGERLSVYRNRPTSLRDVLKRAIGNGERDCWIFSDGRRVTFGQLESEVGSTAAFLSETCGIEQGSRVAICAANCAGWLYALWACASLGAVTVAMNGWWTEVEMRNALQLCEPDLLLLDRKRGDRLGSTPGIPRLDLDHDLEAMLTHLPDATLPDVAIAEDDPVMLMFTSGTTGRPKAAIVTHRVAIAFCMSQSFIGARMAYLGTAPNLSGPPTRLAVSPLFHLSGLSTTAGAMVTGSATVWPLGRFDPAEVIDLSIHEGINVWMGAGTHLMRLFEHPDLDHLDRGQIVQVSMGGSATTPQLLRQCDEKLPHLKGTDWFGLWLDGDRRSRDLRAKLDAGGLGGLRRATPADRQRPHR